MLNNSIYETVLFWGVKSAGSYYTFPFLGQEINIPRVLRGF